MTSKPVDMASKSGLLFLSLAVMTVLVSAHRPMMADQNPASEGSSQTKMDTNSNMMGKIGSDGKMNGMESGMNGMGGMGGMKVSPGMAYGISPIPIPGADGRFQFQLGPIGFGMNWGFGFIPGPLMSYSQPIVISPYMPPSYGMPSPYMPPSSGSTPSPYANVQPYQPQPGAFRPVPQGHMPFPVEGNAHGSSMSYIPYPSHQYASGTNQMSSPAPEHK